MVIPTPLCEEGMIGPEHEALYTSSSADASTVETPTGIASYSSALPSEPRRSASSAHAPPLKGSVEIMKKASSSNKEKPVRVEDATADDLRPEYPFDYQKARPNRFAACGEKKTLTVVLDA